MRNVPKKSRYSTIFAKLRMKNKGLQLRTKTLHRRSKYKEIICYVNIVDCESRLDNKIECVPNKCP